MDDLAFLGANSLRLVAETFGEVRHFYEAFDTAEEARSLVKLLCTDSDSISDAFLESAVENLLQWKISAGPSMKRRRRLHLERIAGTLLLPGEPAPSKPSLEFEEIVHNDPKAFLEAARRAQKRSKDLGGLGSRAEKEDRDRRRYALELASIIEESCLPVALQIVALDKPEIAWLRVWGSRRAKTLRNRFRAWNKFRSWLNAPYGVVWPKDATQVVNFIEELIDYGCPVSYPNELLAALSLLEQVGKVPDSRRIAGDPFLQEHLKSWKVALSGSGKERGPARPYTVAIMTSLELLVVNEETDHYFRFVGWLMLLASWTSLRVDDIQSIQPESLRLSNRGLSFKLARTKTTGPGRIHGAVHGFVCREVSITGEDWMVVGMLSMQRDDMKYPRDYLTPGPSKDFSGFIPKIVEPPELANYFRMVLSRLCTPRFAEGRWTLSEQLLLVPQTLNLFWTGHSARHFATQAAAAIGVEKEKRDYLGRWAIGRVGSNAYLHTSRQVVEAIQREILEALYKQVGAGGYDEQELLEDIKDFADRQGLIGYRLVRRHRILPIDRLDPRFTIAEDTDAEVENEDRHQRNLEAESGTMSGAAHPDSKEGPT